MSLGISQVDLTERMVETTKAVLDDVRAGRPLLVRSKARDDERFTRYQRLESAQNLDRIVDGRFTDKAGTAIGVSEDGRNVQVMTADRIYEVGVLSPAGERSLDRAEEAINEGDYTVAADWSEAAWTQTLPSAKRYALEVTPEPGEATTASFIAEESVNRRAHRVSSNQWAVENDGMFTDDDFRRQYLETKTPGVFSRPGGFAAIRQVLHPGVLDDSLGQSTSFAPGDIAVMPSIGRNNNMMRMLSPDEFSREFNANGIEFAPDGSLNADAKNDPWNKERMQRLDHTTMMSLDMREGQLPMDEVKAASESDPWNTERMKSHIPGDYDGDFDMRAPVGSSYISGDRDGDHPNHPIFRPSIDIEVPDKPEDDGPEFDF